MRLGAFLSPDRLYRYKLTRTWNPNKLPLLWIMKNPSTADERKDDPTVEKCIAYSINKNYGGCTIVNLFAWRATEPLDLLRALDPVGPLNDQVLREEIATATDICCAWGKLDRKLQSREAIVLEMLKTRTVYCLNTNQDGTPTHPLYLPMVSKLVVYRGVQ